MSSLTGHVRDNRNALARRLLTWGGSDFVKRADTLEGRRVLDWSDTLTRIDTLGTFIPDWLHGIDIRRPSMGCPKPAGDRDPWYAPPWHMCETILRHSWGEPESARRSRRCAGARARWARGW